MKGYHVSRSLSQHSSSGPCHCIPEDCNLPRDYMPHTGLSQDARASFEHYQGLNDHPSYYPPGGPPEPLPQSSGGRGGDGGGGGGTFPRSHPSQTYDSCEECLASSSSAQHPHPSSSKMHRLPPNLLDQFEKQLPFQPDGFHTLQYQRAASGEQRSESPSRIRHLVHSVQRLFAKSHSLEAPSKREFNGTRSEYRGGATRGASEDGNYHHYPPPQHHVSRQQRRSKSRERSKSGEPRHRSKTAGWWSSDDNLDSDSSFLVSVGAAGRAGAPPSQEVLDGVIQDLTLKTLKAKGPPGECLACTSMALAGESGHSLKRSTWSSMTVSQAREVYPSNRAGYDKALVPLEPSKSKDRSYQYLQVPSDEWAGGYPAGGQEGGGEIPCRRMRSGSYIKAMGDDDSGDSDASPKASPKTAIIAQREAFRRSISMDQRSSNAKYSCKQCTDSYSNSRTAPKGSSRSRSYARSLTSSQLGETLNRQFEAVCESVFGEVESQAVDALDLPGCFRMRSHSYIRAIQAGCSQDDDCLSVFSLSGTQGGGKPGAVFQYRKAPPPLPPRISKPLISVTAQSSTESTQDAYYQSTGQPAAGRPKQHSNSAESLEGGGRSSRTGHYQSGTGSNTGRSKQHSNSAESLDGSRGVRDIYYHGGQGTVRAKQHSNSADSLLEGGRSSRDRAGGSLGKSASLPQNSISSGRGGLPAQEEHKQEVRGRKWRPSIAVQVDSSETLSDSDTESKALKEVHSIGVQVEEDKRRARFKRSNSVTASVQADLETEGFPALGISMQDKGLQFGCSFQRHSSEPESAGQYSEYRTVHTQGQWAYREDYHSAYDSGPSSMSAPAPAAAERLWQSEGPRSLPDSGQASPCLRDGEFFLRLLQTEVERMEGWCQTMEREAEENDLPEETLEKIRSAVGSAQLLMSQKVQQFFRLCQQSVDPSAYPQPSSQDLAGFWDLLQLAMEDVRAKFQELQRMKDAGWRPTDKKEEKKAPPPLPKKPVAGAGVSVGGLVISRGGKGLPMREKSLDLGDRQRQEVRRRLLSAKRAASFRQNSATESAESIEIYIPEAQTRL
ncbi:disks large-associated protein 3 [Amia ocellicauda]|uniref:disks large-associated protein 3 n=1 Tax=Amia ocellicauda TaxID=2972642 RepID=UPI003463DF21